MMLPDSFFHSFFPILLMTLSGFIGTLRKNYHMNLCNNQANQLTRVRFFVFLSVLIHASHFLKHKKVCIGTCNCTHCCFSGVQCSHRSI